MKPKLRTLAIIAPIYNEELSLSRFLQSVDDSVSVLSTKVHVHFCGINNGSTDESLEIIGSFKPKNMVVSYISLTRNFGYEPAFEAGLRSLEADYYALLDADGEDPVNLLLAFYDSLASGIEIAYGVRESRREATHLQWLRKLFYWFLARISDDPFLRNVGEFSMFTRIVRDSILKENNSYPFWRSGLARMGFKGQGFPHSRNSRIAGKSKLNKRAMFQFAIGGILSTTTSPLRFCAYLLLGMSLCNTLAGICMFTGLISIYAFEATAVLSIACIGFALSIMAIYQARIYKNLLFRPNYFIDHSNSRIAKSLQSHG